MKLNRPNRPLFNTVQHTPEPVEAEVSDQPVIPALTPSKPAIPPLVKSEPVAPAIPKLERAQSGKKQIELLPPQPVSETIGTAEPDQSGGELTELEQESLQEELVEVQTEPVIPEVPKLAITKGTGEPAKIEIPQLDAYNKMEVAHLLIGRSSEDEEIVLIQSFPERFVRTKDKEEFDRQILTRVTQHRAGMLSQSKYDFTERQHNHTFEVKPVSAIHAARGVEWMCALKDNGLPSEADIYGYADRERVEYDVANEEIEEAGLFKKDEEYVFTWALVKVKIGHDFGSYRLSELMPTL